MILNTVLNSETPRIFKHCFRVPKEFERSMITRYRRPGRDRPWNQQYLCPRAASVRGARGIVPELCHRRRVCWFFRICGHTVDLALRYRRISMSAPPSGDVNSSHVSSVCSEKGLRQQNTRNACWKPVREVEQSVSRRLPAGPAA